MQTIWRCFYHTQCTYLPSICCTAHKLRFIGLSERVISSVYKSADGVIQLLEVASQHAWQVATVSGRIDSEHQLVTQVLVDDLSKSHQRSMVWLQQRLEEDKNTMMDIIR